MCTSSDENTVGSNPSVSGCSSICCIKMVSLETTLTSLTLAKLTDLCLEEK